MTRLVSAALLLAVLACQRAPAQSAAPAAPPAAPLAQSNAPAPPKPVPAELPAIVARVNGEAVSRAELERAIRGVEMRAGGPVPPEQRDEVYRGVLDQLIAYRLLVQETRARQVTVPDAEVDKELDAIRRRFPDEQAFSAALKAQQLTLDEVRRDIRQDLEVSKLMDAEVAAKVAVDAAAVKAFYDEHPERFREEEAVRASHILIRVPPEADAQAKARARGEAEAILKALRGGADFATLARERSQDGSAANGGDLGFFTRGQTAPAFEAAAFALEVGQTSGVVETPFGFHVIKLFERRPARLAPFDAVQAEIAAYLRDERRQALADAFIAGLRAKARVEVLF
jgi:peptidyl-prolyl cis-trans isomerase C